MEGVARARVGDVQARDGALFADAQDVITPVSREQREVQAIGRTLLSLFEQYIKTNRKLPPELLQTLAGIEEPERLADTVAAHLGVRLADKQKLLETLDTAERLEMLVGLVAVSYTHLDVYKRQVHCCLRRVPKASVTRCQMRA